ncbi:MAG: hypothetical protein U1E76_19625 [Planctomycetota bacterium]
MLERAAEFPSFARLEPLIEPLCRYLDPAGVSPGLEDAARSARAVVALLLAADLRIAIVRRLRSIPPLAGQRALALIDGFERTVGPSSCGDHLRGLLAQFAPIGDRPTDRWRRFAPGWRRDAAAALLRRAVRDADPAQLARLDLAELLERNAEGERYANGADPAGAAREYDAILARQPRHREALLRGAELLARQGRLRDARLRLAGECSRADCDPDVAARAAALDLELGELETARALGERIGARHPRHVGLLRVRAAAAQRGGDRSRARQLLETALETDPGDAELARELEQLLDR